MKNSAQRTEVLRNIAMSLGMQFLKEDEWGIKALLRDFKLYRSGGSQKICNIIQSTSSMLEEKVSIMDFKYVVHTGKASVPFWQTVFFIQSKELALPEMLLKPENFFHKIGAWLGMQDIDFEEQQEFSDKFLLKGEDENRIRKTMNDSVMRFFLINNEWCMESVGYYLLLYRENKLAKPEEIRALYIKGMKLYSELKTHEN